MIKTDFPASRFQPPVSHLLKVALIGDIDYRLSVAVGIFGLLKQKPKRPVFKAIRSFLSLNKTFTGHGFEEDEIQCMTLDVVGCL